VVKIIQKGVVRPKYNWMRRRWQCGSCNTVVEFEEGDADTLRYTDDQRDGESITTNCPLCNVKRYFYPVKYATN
jgi:rubredoxin